jgi:hypothetical protein
MFYSYGRKALRPTAPKRKKKSNDFRLIRLNAQVQKKTTREVAKAKLLSTDLRPHGVTLFVDRPFTRGDLVTMAIDKPNHLYVKGIVRWCGIQQLDLKILSTESFVYRVCIQFYFESPDEVEALRQFTL